MFPLLITGGLTAVTASFPNCDLQYCSDYMGENNSWKYCGFKAIIGNCFPVSILRIVWCKMDVFGFLLNSVPFAYLDSGFR